MPTDAEQVYLLLQEVSIFRPNIINAEVYENFSKNANNSYSVVAHLEHKVIGFGSIFYFTRVRGGKCALIEDVVVDENFRSNGIGERIINCLISTAKDAGCFKVSLEASRKARKFYSKCGFQDAEQTMKIIL